MNSNAFADNNFDAFPKLKCRDGIRAVSVLGLCALAVITSAAALVLVPSLSVVEVSFTTVLAFLLPVAVLVAGCMHAESRLCKRLDLLEKVSRLAAECQDHDHMLHALTTLLRASQRAPTCLVVVNDSAGTGWIIYKATMRAGITVTRVRKLEASHVDPVVALCQSDDVLVYGRRNWWSVRRNCVAYNADLLERQPADDPRCDSLAKVLEADAFISFPLRTRRYTIGRVHLGLTRRTHAWRDLRFLLQVATQTAAMIEGVQTTSAAPVDTTIYERTRISRDLHDSTIQPYVGLKLGLEALRRKCAPDDELAHDIDELLQMTTDNIGELRSYVGSLKSRPPHQQRISVVPSIRYQAGRFSEYHCINVQVVSDQDVLVSRALFDEIMHITREGLYNVRRHTASKNVTIAVSTIDQELLLEITNNENTRAEAPTFCPRSITDRATDLGGRVTVQRRHLGCTAVSIRIPLR